MRTTTAFLEFRPDGYLTRSEIFNWPFRDRGGLSRNEFAGPGRADRLSCAGPL